MYALICEFGKSTITLAISSNQGDLEQKAQYYNDTDPYCYHYVVWIDM